VRALVCDFDGLILDTETVVFESWRAVYAAHGLDLPREEWVAAIGTSGQSFDPLARLLDLAAGPLDAEAIQARRRAHRDAFFAGLAPLPGVEAWLRRARAHGLGIAIASSSPLAWVEPLLVGAGLARYFDELVTLECAPRAKPHPDLFERAVAVLGVAASEAVALEDSPHGVRAAKVAGLFCVAVPGPMTQGLDFGEADRVLPSLAAWSLDELLATGASASPRGR
jgi:HAD superfamily hydrolase (TIGR01509 family)